MALASGRTDDVVAKVWPIRQKQAKTRLFHWSLCGAIMLAMRQVKVQNPRQRVCRA
jgi:hypothetical protein